jgi:predicted nuclease of restriction endonuclease-like (RecB) superfamily
MANENNESKRDLTVLSNGLAISDSEYVRLVSLISDTWEKAKGRAALAVNTELLDANWQTGRYIVEFEQGGNTKARYGEQLITNLAKDLTRLRGKGFSRSNLFNMRLFYVRFPKIQTVSGQLTWSHYLELLKCDDSLEMQFYMKECINQGWKVRELKRQINSSLFQRLALSTDKEGVMALASEGHQVQTANDIIRDPFVLEFTGLPKQKRYKEKDLEDALKANMEKFLLEYLNYFKNEVCQPDDNPPVGIVLGARKDELLMEYALQGIDNQLFAARYQLYLPHREELQSELDKLLDNTK